MIRYLGDFILQENSPYHEPSQIRTQMGGAYGSPNFSSILKTIIVMVSDKELLAKYPLDAKNQYVVSHKDILQKMIEPGEGANACDFNDILLDMARDDAKTSKKMAKAYLKGVNKTGVEALQQSLRQIQQFLRIDDSLKQVRMEWIFGIPQVVSKSQFRTKQMQYGVELVEMVADEYYMFKSGYVKGVNDAFLGQLYKAKGRMDTQCVIGLKALLEMCLEDVAVAQYVFRQPSPSMQFARYTDWFFPYAESLRQSTLNQIMNSTTMLEYHKNRLESLDQIMGMKPKLDAVFTPLIEEQKTKLDQMDDSSFVGYKE